MPSGPPTWPGRTVRGLQGSYSCAAGRQRQPPIAGFRCGRSSASSAGCRRPAPDRASPGEAPSVVRRSRSAPFVVVVLEDVEAGIIVATCLLGQVAVHHPGGHALIAQGERVLDADVAVAIAERRQPVALGGHQRRVGAAQAEKGQERTLSLRGSHVGLGADHRSGRFGFGGGPVLLRRDGEGTLQRGVCAFEFFDLTMLLANQVGQVDFGDANGLPYHVFSMPPMRPFLLLTLNPGGALNESSASFMPPPSLRCTLRRRRCPPCRPASPGRISAGWTCRAGGAVGAAPAGWRRCSRTQGCRGRPSRYGSG